MIKQFFVLTALAAASVAAAAAQDISGDWQGPLTTPMGELRLVLHVTKQADGSYKGTMDSPDQNTSGAPLDVISLEGSKVHFTLNIAKGSFDGTLKNNGTISGNWSQGTPPQKMPLVLTKTTTPLKIQHAPAPPSDIDGTWEGTYELPTTGVPEKKQVTFHVTNTADGLTATFDLADMGAKAWPATEVTRKGNSIKIRMNQFGVIVHVKVNKTLDDMTGDWMQGDDPARTLHMKKTQGPMAEAPKPAAKQ